MQVTPNIFISKRNSIKSNLEKDSIPIQSSFKDFVQNINLIETLGTIFMILIVLVLLSSHTPIVL